MALLTASALGCGKDRWQGFVYPDREDLTQWEELGEFDGLDACKLAAIQHLNAMNRLPGPNPENPWRKMGTYECARGCRPFGDGSDMKICKETIGDSHAEIPTGKRP